MLPTVLKVVSACPGAEGSFEIHEETGLAYSINVLPKDIKLLFNAMENNPHPPPLTTKKETTPLTAPAACSYK